MFKRLQARDKEEETKRVMEEQTARRFANFETIELVLDETLMNSQIRGEQIGQQSLLPEENTQTSRFKGTGRLCQWKKSPIDTLGSVSK